MKVLFQMPTIFVIMTFFLSHISNIDVVTAK